MNIMDKVKLSSELEEDIEKISENIHRVWAEQRTKQGWSYGEVYDAEKKKHPCLIEYNALSETEKDVDRATVIGTIKNLILLGYKIEKNEEEK